MREKNAAAYSCDPVVSGRSIDSARPQDCAIATEFTVEINRDLEGRYQVSVDGRVRWAGYDQELAIRIGKAINPQMPDPIIRDQSLGEAIVHSHRLASAGWSNGGAALERLRLPKTSRKRVYAR